LRAFWAILGILMLASAVYLLIGRGESQKSTAAPAPPIARADLVAPLIATAAPPAPSIAAQPAAEPARDPMPGGEETIGRTTFFPEPGAAQPAPTPEPQPGEGVAPPQPTPEAEPPSETPLETPPPPRPEAKPEHPAEAPAPVIAQEPLPVAPADVPAPAQPPPAQPAPADNWLVTRDDGTMVADGRYTIRGKGTQQEPYKISWEHLISAEEDYVPREGRAEIPRRIQMLHDKHVEITGYVAFPLLMDEADELLVMLNQWDGCCLGVPPTPYDAVEVRLKNFVTGNARMTSYGTLRGLMKVEPHLVGEWLVGLYLMEDASLAPLAYGGFAP
jgi:outer membrane biosynthesis protein TonB